MYAANQHKPPFSPLTIPQQSLLGAPPGGRGMPVSPFLNAAVFNRGMGMPQRGAIVKPHMGNFGKKPASGPVHVNNGEISFKFIDNLLFFYFLH